MPTFVLMTKLSSDAVHDSKVRRALGKEWMHKVRASCPDVKWLAHYSLLGPYDFMDIYDAPDVDTAHRVSVVSRSEGALVAESWPALAYDRFIEVLEEVQS